MDTKGNKILNRVWAKMRKKWPDPEPPRQFTPPPPIEPPPPRQGYKVGGTAEQKGRSHYRNPVIKQAPSNDPRFNHKLRRA